MRNRTIGGVWLVNYFRRYIALGLSALLLLTAVAPVLADELEDQLGDVQQQMNAQQNSINNAQQKVESVSEQLRVIQQQMDAAQAEYKSIQGQLSNTEQQIQMNTDILQKTEKSLAARTTVLNKRARDIYKNGQVSYLEVLLGASDFGDFTTRMEFLQRVLKQDVSLFAQVKAERQLILQKKAELEQEKAAILELQKAAAEKKQIMEARKQDREKVLASAMGDKEAAERAYQELMETSRRIEQMLRNSRRPSGPAGSTGALMWPINGPITSEFGWRTHPIYGTARYHSGLDIGADEGDPVAAADGGIVIHAGWLGGYGYAVIIQHSDSISTLYGHNSQLLVSEGQQVRKGEIIALAGSTGDSTGPHVHFEVRENGTPVSPWNYLP